MKKFLLIFVLMIVAFSCEKNDSETIQDNNYNQVKADAIPEQDIEALIELEARETKSIPLFDESNTELINWNSFPEELKNAKQISSSSINESNFKTLASYSYQAGPWGGSGGNYFSHSPSGSSKIHAIAIRAGSLIDKLIVYYKKSDGTIYAGINRGGNGGNYYIQFFTDGEYIRSVSGRSGKHVNRLRFNTNKKSFQYGGSGGNYFYLSTPYNHKIFSFYGRSGSLIDNIGFRCYKR